MTKAWLSIAQRSNDMEEIGSFSANELLAMSLWTEWGIWQGFESQVPECSIWVPHKLSSLHSKSSHLSGWRGTKREWKAGAFVTSYKCWCLNWGGGRNRAGLVSKSGEWRFHLSKCLHVTIKEGVGLHGALCRSCRTLGFGFLLFHFPLPSSAELILFKCV